MSMSVLCLLTGQTARGVRDDPALADVVPRLLDEANSIAQSCYPEVKRVTRTGPAPAHKPSILQDYELGRAMEIDVLVRAPAAFARAAGLVDADARSDGRARDPPGARQGALPGRLKRCRRSERLQTQPIEQFAVGSFSGLPAVSKVSPTKIELAPAKKQSACISSLMAERPADRRTKDFGIMMRASAMMRMNSIGAIGAASASGVPGIGISMLIGTLSVLRADWPASSASRHDHFFLAHAEDAAAADLHAGLPDVFERSRRSEKLRVEITFG